MDKRVSFITDHMGDFLRDVLPKIAFPVVLWGTIIYLVLFGLTFICHWPIVCNLYSLVSGFTLISIVYVLSVILVLDNILLYKVCHSQPPYRATIIWGVVLIVAGIVFLFLTNHHKKQYRFDCSEWLIDETTGLYHVTYDCEEIGKAAYIIKGYELRECEYDLCEWCKEYIEDLELAYEPIIRRR
ncbi:MAG: efflux RND transporter permease subunit [Bacteroidales bacterium]|nr:efflux RND transporter permease subunit [Bacteroidales bacterium]